MKNLRTVLVGVVLIPLVFATVTAAVNIDVPGRVTQGGIYVVTLSGDDTVMSARGIFARRNVHFNPTGVSGSFTGLLGVDLSASPEVRTLVVTVKKSNGITETLTRSITITRGDFSVQRLTMDEKWANKPDEATLKRIERETGVVTALYATETPRRLWSEAFMMPLIGGITGAFGLARYINGKPSSPHSGIDIAAVTGTPVVAANDGTVALVMDMYYSGLSLFIDHGQGLYTMYFHLSDVLVTGGESVKRGQAIARVGATGRVTGAHLHFGARLNYNKVNPAELMGKRID
ncbi:MAG: M23 family metallopeptidase [Deltaproteobacteria bacterium]|nr:M23 family metallopeptidase [Candidatus Zymogenaceae bacterium]